MSDGMGREPAYLSSHATNRYFIPNWGREVNGHAPFFGRKVSVSAMLVSMRQKNIAQVSILERYFFVSTYQAAGPDTCLAVFVVASLPPCL